MLGRKLSEETRRKMRETHLRLKSGDRLPKNPKGVRPKFNEEIREKMRESAKERFSDKTKHPRWKGGKPRCLDCGKLLVRSVYTTKRCRDCHNAYRRIYQGSKSAYRSLHQWVEKQLGKPEGCSKCGRIGRGKIMHWANKSGEYRKDITDWIRLCYWCHKEYDRKAVL